MKTAGKRLKTKRCAFSLNEAVELHAQGLQRFKKGWETFIRQKPASGWQVPELQMATTNAWLPSALLTATHFSRSWRHISTRIDRFVFERCLKNPHRITALCNKRHTRSNFWCVTPRFIGPTQLRCCAACLQTQPTSTYLHLLAWHRLRSFATCFCSPSAKEIQADEITVAVVRLSCWDIREIHLCQSHVWRKQTCCADSCYRHGKIGVYYFRWCVMYFL